jgi:4'-phosphopantetheinyl transferase
VEPVEMSVSHSGDWVAVAFCSGAAVGVDVEQVDLSVDTATLRRHVLAVSEAEALDRLAPSARAATLVAYWVRKEAILKAIGVGLRVSPTAVVVSPPDQPPSLVRASPDLGPLRLLDLSPRPGYVASLAMITPEPTAVVELDARALLVRPDPRTLRGPGRWASSRLP